MLAKGAVGNEDREVSVGFEEDDLRDSGHRRMRDQERSGQIEINCQSGGLRLQEGQVPARLLCSASDCCLGRDCATLRKLRPKR